ncbi:DUF4381 domain-containing protein [Rhizobium sp. Root483D2]|uniref:DUF4381 domain-containing protein n=1 Tax=Rhizobium sp. Root483D2 TaxID=1736545 RepID=UPI00071513CD|nr:DUF4381 domain-containing protein [Rhizobium sp. Root483D2]KQY33855.1 hypothetical protein ASD32_21505 [Rhizobium sp. Root483D2]
MEPDKAAPLDPLTKVALESLKDIAVPQPVSWMPQTWGWALAAILLALAVTIVLIRWVRHYRANAYRREALLLLDGLEKDLNGTATRDQALRALAAILKRVAIAGWSRAEVAGLSGSAWVAFLNEHGEGGHALNALLDDGEYQKDSNAGTLASSDILAAARTWIRRHHVSA